MKELSKHLLYKGQITISTVDSSCNNRFVKCLCLQCSDRYKKHPLYINHFLVEVEICWYHWFVVIIYVVPENHENDYTDILQGGEHAHWDTTFLLPMFQKNHDDCLCMSRFPEVVNNFFECTKACFSSQVKTSNSTMRVWTKNNSMQIVMAKTQFVVKNHNVMWL